MPDSERWITRLGIIAMLVMGLGTSSWASASAQTAPEGAPVDIHSGTCEEPVQEPAFDVGQLQQTTFTADNGNLDALALADADGNEAWGFDVNGDNVLQNEEILVRQGEETPGYFAQGELNGGIPEGEEYVVVIHESEENYFSYLACGAITGQAAEDGNRIVRLEPLADSGLSGYSVISGDIIDTYIFEPGQMPQAQAEEQADWLPIDIHSGSCLDPLTEPAYDFGELKPIPVTGAEGEVAIRPGGAPGDRAFLGDDGTLNEADEGFVFEDVDGDGMIEIGVDANLDGTLNEDEILGTDANQDNMLTGDEITQQLEPAEGALAQTQAWKEDIQVDASGAQLLSEGPYVVLVHESEENYANYVACGEISGFAEEGELVVPLRPVGDNDYFGVALIEIDSAEYAGYLFQPIQVEEAAAQAATPPAGEAATPAA